MSNYEEITKLNETVRESCRIAMAELNVEEYKRQCQTIEKIFEHVKRAREKHPILGDPWPALMEEIGEVAKAINDNDPDNIPKELMDTAAVIIRWLEGDN